MKKGNKEKRELQNICTLKREKAYLYIFYTVFTDAIEVCIKKFVHFLRKGFIKIITNISCLKPGEKEAEGHEAHDDQRTF